LNFNELDKSQKIRNHYTVNEIIDLIGIEKWNNAFKFTCVRNPLDRLYSFYAFRVKNGRIKNESHLVSFKKWVFYELEERDPLSKKRFNLLPQSDWLIDLQNEIRLDFIGRFENVKEDFDRLGRIIPSQKKLSHLNKSPREQNYKQHYDAELKAFVMEYYQIDIENFKYKI
jgi:chondroitin 4-sulfotransferase 11